MSIITYQMKFDKRNHHAEHAYINVYNVERNLDMKT